MSLKGRAISVLQVAIDRMPRVIIVTSRSRREYTVLVSRRGDYVSLAGTLGWECDGVIHPSFMDGSLPAFHERYREHAYDDQFDVLQQLGRYQLELPGGGFKMKIPLRDGEWAGAHDNLLRTVIGWARDNRVRMIFWGSRVS